MCARDVSPGSAADAADATVAVAVRLKTARQDTMRGAGRRKEVSPHSSYRPDLR